jgi:hypothetical protein
VLTSHFSLVNATFDQDYPVLIDFLLNYTPESTISKIKSSFNLEKLKLEKLFTNLDILKIKNLIAEASPFFAPEVALLQLEIKQYYYRKQLSATLDLIGMFEAITGLNLETISHKELSNLVAENKVLNDLMISATNLKF